MRRRCRKCRRMFTPRSTNPVCATCREQARRESALERIRHKVAPDARPGETLEAYLERRDREAWNMGEGPCLGGSNDC